MTLTTIKRAPHNSTKYRLFEQVYLQCIKLENVAEDSIIEVNNQLDQLLELNKWYGSNHVTCPVLSASQLSPGKSSMFLVYCSSFTFTELCF